MKYIVPTSKGVFILLLLLSLYIGTDTLLSSIPNNPIIAWDPRSHNWTDYTAYTNTRVYLDDIETYVAVKISVAETEHNGNTRELQTMKKMASHHPRPKYTVRMLDDFNLNGPNGSHKCLVYELLGPNVPDTIDAARLAAL